MVADALSMETAHSSTLIMKESKLHANFERAEIAVVAVEDIWAQLARLTVQPTLLKRIVETHVVVNKLK